MARMASQIMSRSGVTSIGGPYGIVFGEVRMFCTGTDFVVLHEYARGEGDMAFTVRNESLPFDFRAWEISSSIPSADLLLSPWCRRIAAATKIVVCGAYVLRFRSLIRT